MTVIDQIIANFGTKSEAARKLGVFPQSFTRWTVYGVPASVAIEIERVTNGKFKAIDIPLYSRTPLKERTDALAGVQQNQAA